MHKIPKGAPTNLYEAFSYIASVSQPKIDDLKLLVILEAAGKAMYDALAESVEDREVRALLQESGQDELLHAKRVSQAIVKLTGEAYPIPGTTENPYLVDWVKPVLTRDMIEGLVGAELGGEALYASWAANCPNAEAARLFEQNGSEEANHAQRLRVIAGRLQ